jgi:hypothetical protein
VLRKQKTAPETDYNLSQTSSSGSLGFVTPSDVALAAIWMGSRQLTEFSPTFHPIHGVFASRKRLITRGEKTTLSWAFTSTNPMELFPSNFAIVEVNSRNRILKLFFD